MGSMTEPGQIASQAGMPLPTAVPGIPMTSAGDIPGIPGGNSSADHYTTIRWLVWYTTAVDGWTATFGIERGGV